MKAHARRTIPALVLAAVVLLLLSSRAAVPNQTTPELTAPPLAVTLIVQPSLLDRYQLLRRPTPSTFTCFAMIYEPGTRKVYARPKVVVAPGTRETAKAKVQTAGLDIDFTVEIGKAADSAQTELVIRKDGRILNEQRSTVLLRLPQTGIRPAE